MNNSYITIIKEKRTVLSRKRVPLNQNECTADFRIGVPFEQNLHDSLILRYKLHITDNKMTIQLDEDIANTYKTVQKRTVLKLEQ